MNNKKDKLIDFKDLIKYAELFISDHAQPIIEIIRGKKYGNIKTMIEEKYHPIWKESCEIPFDIILKRFCIELQNYQAMPKAINYISYSKDDDALNDENKIYELVLNYLENEFNNISNDNYKDIFKSLQKNESDYQGITGDNNKELNYAWDKYSRGIMNVLVQIKGESKETEYNDKVKKSYIDKIKNYCEYFDEIDEDKISCIINELYDLIKTNKNISKKYTNYYEFKKTKLEAFHKNLHGMRDTLTYDLFKELHCLKLIKDDIHVFDCYKLIFGEEEIKTYKQRDLALFKFLKLCFDYKDKDGKSYAPYYIDKILWLCCTGNFYEDGITIHKMNKKNFFKFIDDEISK